MSEIGFNRREMAHFLEVGENRFGNWLGRGSKASMPAEEAMILLCEKVRGLTMDYLYRGMLDHVPTGLAIRLTAREQGIDPDAEPTTAQAVLQAGSRALRDA